MLAVNPSVHRYLSCTSLHFPPSLLPCTHPPRWVLGNSAGLLLHASRSVSVVWMILYRLNHGEGRISVAVDRLLVA